MELAVKDFASSLEVGHQCAVLIILSHGSDGYVHGSDGHEHRVPIEKLVEYLDNIHCVQMAGKPKIIIIQACQGGENIYLHIYRLDY